MLRDFYHRRWTTWFDRGMTEPEGGWFEMEWDWAHNDSTRYPPTEPTGSTREVASPPRKISAPQIKTPYISPIHVHQLHGSTRILRGFPRAGKLSPSSVSNGSTAAIRALRFAAMVADSLLWTAIIGVWIWMFYWAGQITSFCSFLCTHTVDDPTVLPGDCGIVNKWRLGARIFDIKKAVAGERVTIYRLPRLWQDRTWRDSGVQRSLAAPDSIGLNLRRYYCKRIIGLPGDTLSIVDGHYKVAGYDGLCAPYRPKTIWAIS